MLLRVVLSLRTKLLLLSLPTRFISLNTEELANKYNPNHERRAVPVGEVFGFLLYLNLLKEKYLFYSKL